MGQYTYRVLRKVKSSDDVPKDAVLYVDCGEQESKTADQAALAVGTKLRKTGHYHPISARHFNETEVVPSPGFAIGDGSTPVDEAVPQDGLDPGLNPDQPCETEDCGHLPAEHGAKGLGICRIEGCPCGKYEPAPAF